MTNDLKFNWVVNKGRFESGETLYVGRLAVGSYSSNFSRSREDVEKRINAFMTTFRLIGFNKNNVPANTVDEAKSIIERRFRGFYKALHENADLAKELINA